MAKGFYIEADLKELIRELRDKGEDLVTIVDAEIAATAKDIERIAAQRARKVHGNLAGSIVADQEVQVHAWKVVVHAHYAPYVEFGTGDLVKIPAGLEKYAEQFKGKGIRKVNLPARPFFFNTYFEQVAELKTRLQEELKRL